ncbi:glycosyltransferase family 2 protein [Olivibacter ginsenosidimutans]|uniref:Glycosyltransferase family 2 protein n=1 Tax=Olivibacter ginsenosidimutans TaxID=1176537 RepID=A0ABP9B062_9SPHI
MNKQVAVVILNWNGRAYLEQFLPLVCASTYPNITIIVGDNASTDTSVAFIRTHFPQVTLIEHKVNYGFAEGYNRTLQQVKADYFVLLNSDVEVSSRWIEPIIQVMESEPTIAAAQPKILAYQQRHIFEHAGAAGGYIDWLGYPFCAGRILDQVETDQQQYQHDKEIFWASGAALFIKRKAWEEAGGFDPDFFAHMEEIDLCWRLKQRGYKIVYCAASCVYHIGGGTLQKENPFKTYLNFRNNLFMLQKNLPFGKAVCVIFIRFWLDFIALLRFLLSGKRKDALAISKAHISFFRNFGKTMKKRKLIKQQTNITGVYKASIIWAYFVLGRKKFTQLNPKKFS